MDEIKKGQHDIILATGRIYKMDEFDEACMSFNAIKSKLDSSEVLMNMYELMQRYIHLLIDEINESGKKKSSHRILLKIIRIIDWHLQAILHILVIESTKNQSIKKINKWKKKCLKYTNKIDILIYTRTSLMSFHYFNITNDAELNSVSTNHIKPIYVLAYLLENFSTILKKVLLLY